MMMFLGTLQKLVITFFENHVTLVTIDQLGFRGDGSTVCATRTLLQVSAFVASC